MATPDPTPPIPPVAQIRPLESDLPLPDGWVAAEIRWDGSDREIAYDPARFAVLRVHDGSIAGELRALLSQSGWRCCGTDTDAAELWVQDRQQQNLARLDRLSHPAAPGGDVLYVA